MGKGLVRGRNQSRILTYFVWAGGGWLLLLCDDCGWLAGWLDGWLGGWLWLVFGMMPWHAKLYLDCMGGVLVCIKVLFILFYFYF